MEYYIDLHMHSKYSTDGEYEPEELVEMCHEKGIKMMAVTDHNLVNAVKPARKRAEELGIKYISGTEIDCTYKDTDLHVLAYDIPEDEPYFQTLNDKIYEQELKASAKKLELTRQLGFEITKEEIDKLTDNGVYLGEMFAEILLQKEEYKDHPLLKPYREGGSRSDNACLNFHWDYYSQGKPCYIDIKYASYEETVKNIQKYGGKAILAHPGQNLKGQFELFDEMMKAAPLDGVEVYSNYHNPEDIEYFKAKVEEYQIMTTCGSDFHGKIKPTIQLGESHCGEEEQKRILKQMEKFL